MTVTARKSFPVVAMLLCACLDGADAPDKPDPERPISGMAAIASEGMTFLQGSGSEWAGPSEGPPLLNGFSYEFQIDTTEVTQGRFHALMGREPVPASGRFGKGDAYPVYNVSWFDAALFCNARSKSLGLDTVYAYARAEQAAGGSVFNLAGLIVQWDKRGFRLPTEAEWEFAARAGSPDEFAWGGSADSGLVGGHAWYSGNSGGATHPVAGLRANAFGLYDMAGNVMEWVNDWKGAYPASGSLDFTGARDPGPEFDTPLKGGAFKYGLRELRPANRTATYTAVRSSTAEYVGFRCVIGVIAKPRFSTPDGAWAETDPMRLDITRIGNLVGGRPAKLVFVNANQSVRHLAYVDYQRNPIRVVEFGDIANVFYPVISPDGDWAAFGTALEGSVSGSSVFVRRLGDTTTAAIPIGAGFIPRWWVEPATRDTFLVYATSAADNSQPQWRDSRTVMRKFRDGAPAGPPVDVAQGGFHDGRSADGRWLATGYRHLMIRDGVTERSRTLFTAPFNGKEDGDTSQVCNVSIAPDSSGNTLFLDFGYEGKSGLTGTFYDIHQVAFMADPDGRVLRWIKSPAGERGWDDLEWSNRTGYAVSGAADASDRHRALYLLDLEDSLTTRLVSGTQLATPGLWLGEAPEAIPGSGLDPDSLGHYNGPATDVSQEIFSSHMHWFWKRHKSLELLFTGSSHVFSGIDPYRITKLKSMSMGYPANGWKGQEEWVVHYALNHCPRLKVLVMEAFPGWLKYPEGDFTWDEKISRTRGVRYDSSNGFWKDGLPFRFEDLAARAPYSTTYAWDSLGYAAGEVGDWGGAPLVPVDAEWGLELPAYRNNMARIEALAKVVAERKIHLVLVNFPTSPAYKGTAYYGPYGPRAEVAAPIIRRFRDMEGISPYIHFYDAHADGGHDYSQSEATNSGHLSALGAAKLTSRLDSLVNGFAFP